MNPPELPTTPIGYLVFGASVALQFAIALFKLWAWRKSAEDRLQYARLIAAAPTDDVRKDLLQTPPDPPPRLGPWVLLLAGGALLGLLFSAARGELHLAQRWLGGGDLLAKAGPISRDLCTVNSDCPSGCACDRGRCSCPARRPIDRRRPRLVGEPGDFPAAVPWMAVALPPALQ